MSKTSFADILDSIHIPKAVDKRKTVIVYIESLEASNINGVTIQNSGIARNVKNSNKTQHKPNNIIKLVITSEAVESNLPDNAISRNIIRQNTKDTINKNAFSGNNMRKYTMEYVTM